MKNLSIALGVLAVLAAVIFGVRSVLPKIETSGIEKLDDIAGVATSTNPEKPATTTAEKGIVDVLQLAALKIIDRPITIKTTLSEQTKQLAIQKINEASDMIRANYDYANQWYDLGAYRKMIGDYIGADEAWSFVSRIRPDDFISLHNLGDLYYSLKNYSKAEQYFLASIEKNPQNADAYIQLVAIYEFNDLSKTSLIEPLLLRGITANPKEPNLMIALGKYYQNRGNLEGARNYFTQALALNPKNTELERELQLLGK